MNRSALRVRRFVVGLYYLAMGWVVYGAILQPLLSFEQCALLGIFLLSVGRPP
jgi:hypothetical protein